VGRENASSDAVESFVRESLQPRTKAFVAGANAAAVAAGDML